MTDTNKPAPVPAQAKPAEKPVVGPELVKSPDKPEFIINYTATLSRRDHFACAILTGYVTRAGLPAANKADGTGRTIAQIVDGFLIEFDKPRGA